MATAGEALQALRHDLAEAGIDEAAATADLLLAHILGLSRTALLAHPEPTLSDQQVQALVGAKERLLGGEPLAYILGRREFYGLEFEVSPAVLIPRPETELLVELALAAAEEALFADRPLLIADVGAGSGCIAVAIAVHLRRANLLAIENSGDALAMAARNAQRHRVLPRIALVEADLTEPFGPVDILVANPPYVPTADVDRMLRGPRHEPHLAIDGGPDGLDVLRALVPLFPLRVRRPGVALVEIGSDHAKAVTRMAAEGGARIRVHRDLAGLDRVVEARFE